MSEVNIRRQLTTFEWLQMPKEIRNLFIKWFGIPRTGGAIVQGNEVLSDGHTMQDLSRVSLASLQAFLHTDHDHWDNLLKETINKMENYIDEYSPATEGVGIKSPAISSRGRKKKIKETA